MFFLFFYFFTFFTYASKVVILCRANLQNGESENTRSKARWKYRDRPTLYLLFFDLSWKFPFVYRKPEKKGNFQCSLFFSTFEIECVTFSKKTYFQFVGFSSVVSFSIDGMRNIECLSISWSQKIDIELFITKRTLLTHINFLVNNTIDWSFLLSIWFIIQHQLIYTYQISSSSRVAANFSC